MSYKGVKQAIARSSVLKYFDPSASTVVQCDASSTGLGAALLQAEQPVIFASQSLTSTEQNYCQLEKELLTVVFALQRFDPWPEICDIWLGKRTVSVLAVAKEVAVLQRWPRSRSGRTEDRSTTNCGETFCLVICLSFVWMFFFPSRSNH